MSAILGAGAVIQLNISGTYNSILNVTHIGGPDIKVNPVKATVLTSAQLFDEFIAGWADPGSVPCEARYLNTQFATLYINIRTMNTWRIIFSDNSKWDFTGFLEALATDNPLEEDVSMPFSIKITGKPIFTQ